MHSGNGGFRRREDCLVEFIFGRALRHPTDVDAMDLFHVGGFARRSLAVQGVVSDDECSVVVEMGERREK